MFDHIGLRVRDLAAASQLYKAMLAPLGQVPGAQGATYAGFGPQGRPALWLHLEKDPKKRGGSHVALKAPSRAAVERFHAEGLKAGAKDHGAPGLRVDYAPNYYAAFLLDADGNNVEAVFMEA
jgi:catechol 2,3-dioxygenase-like lactoylglutathione lyase family enzyme